MSEHTYVLRFRVTGIDPDDFSTADALNEGPADVIVGSIDGLGYVEIILRASTLPRAIVDALRHLHDRAPHLTPCRLEQELAGTTELSNRLGIARETVRLWATGQRHKIGFPSPAHHVDGHRIWDWGEVQAWAREHGQRVEAEHYPDADTAAIVNGALAECRRSTSTPAAMLVSQRLQTAGKPGKKGNEPGELPWARACDYLLRGTEGPSDVAGQWSFVGSGKHRGADAEAKADS